MPFYRQRGRMQGNSRLQADEVQLHQKQAEGQPEPIAHRRCAG